MSKQPDTLTLYVAEDAFDGDAQFSVDIDGVAVPGTYTATASRSSGQLSQIVISQALSAGPHQVKVTLLNGVSGGQGSTRDLLISSASLDGNTTGLGTVLNANGATAQFTVQPPTDTLGLFIDQGGQSGVQFTVTVDGNQVGGTYTTNAQASQGQFDQIYANGAFGAGPHTVTVTEVGAAGQQNPSIYLGNVVFDGTSESVGATLTGSGASATFTVGGGSSTTTVTAGGSSTPSSGTATGGSASGGTGTGGTASSGGTTTSGGTGGSASGTGSSTTSSGTASSGTTSSGTASSGTASSGTTSSGTTTTGADTLVLNVAEDAYGGDAQFTISVDGKQVGGTQTATTLRSSGNTQAVTVQGDWGAGQHTVQVSLLNGYTGNTQNAVRDLLIASASLDGNSNGLGTVLQAGGSTSQFVVQPPLDTLVLGLSQTGGQGNAQVTVSVDGVATGQTYTINGQHAQGQDDQITLNGRWGAGPHTIVVTDVAPASSASSPSIYVDTADFDGSTGTVGAVLSSPGKTASISAGGSAAPPILLSGTTSSTGSGSSSSTGSSSGTSTGGSGTGTSSSGSSGTGGTTTTTTSGSGQFEYLGVNLSGAEFGISDPTDGNYSIGTYGTNYTYPTHAELDYNASEGLNVIGLPFSWERLQPTENGPLDQTQLGYIDDIVHYAATKGLSVILDPHNYGYGYGNLIGSSGTPDSAFDSLWSQLAGHYSGQSNVIFGLMNEPHVQTPAQWVNPVNDAIAAIRATGAGQEILVPGTDWTGGDTWVSSGNASIFASNVVDPDHNIAFEIHQYSDADGSGSSTSVVSTTIGEQRLEAVTQWAEQTGNKLFLGEFGAGSDPASIANMTNMLSYMQQHSDAWQGATEWGGGPWWGSYGFATDPVNGVTTPQVATLASFAPLKAVT